MKEIIPSEEMLATTFLIVGLGWEIIRFETDKLPAIASEVVTP